MNIDRTLKVVEDAFLKYLNRPVTEILTLLELTLKNNDFYFGKIVFLQILGIAMGEPFSWGGCANLYLEELDDGAMNNFKIHPRLFLRFLGDIFLIWPGPPLSILEYESF
jgi:hypothetical protein